MQLSTVQALVMNEGNVVSQTFELLMKFYWCDLSRSHISNWRFDTDNNLILKWVNPPGFPMWNENEAETPRPINDMYKYK